MDPEQARDSSPLPASVLVLLSFGVAGLLAASWPPAPAGAAAVLLALLVYEWTNVHGRRLSRRMRALFDESNVLLTYQPRARSMGHLFEAEPPTPVPMEMRREGKEEPERSAFNRARDAHYAGEYQKICKLHNEMKATAGKSSSSSSSKPPPKSSSLLDLDDGTEGAEL